MTEEHGVFDVREFAGELDRAPANHDIGTTLLFENDRVRVFQLRLEPGERAPFHIHDADYFWTVVEPGRGLQRFADGTSVVRNYRIGETRFLDPGPEDPLIHDQENVGDTPLAFVTVELKR